MCLIVMIEKAYREAMDDLDQFLIRQQARFLSNRGNLLVSHPDMIGDLYLDDFEEHYLPEESVEGYEVAESK